MPKPNAILTVAEPGDRVDGVDVGHIDHPLPTLSQPDVTAWLAANCDEDQGDYLLLDVEVDEPSSVDLSGWPHLLVTLTTDEVAAVRAAAASQTDEEQQ